MKDLKNIRLDVMKTIEKKIDGLIQTYQRGHKAVMNTHTVGGR